ANAQFALRLERGPGWDMLGAAAGPIFALDGAGENLDGFAFPASMRLILGEEGKGLPEGLATQRLAIATTGAVESLNATVAASLALFLHFQAHPSR
ncbi:MAG: TrmH family RNA methyltransferase, partial [Rhizobiales bacterium]|nr:TrmH family RNA methyltransferase [Hyphomicrobiales bacterium]